MPHGSAAEDEKITDLLFQNGCCKKCCQRFVGERASATYRAIHSFELRDIEKAEKDNPDNPKPKRDPCVACLGVLQDQFMMENLEEVSQSILNCGYDAEQFTLSLSLPICLSIRQHSLWLHLIDKIPSCMASRNQGQVVPVKQVWKYVYPDIVSKRVKMKCETGDTAEFFAEMVVEFKDDEEEMNTMMKICEKEYAGRAKMKNVYNMGVFSRAGVEKSLADVSKEQFGDFYPVPPAAPKQPFTMSMIQKRNSIWIGGRYNKLGRDLPQTPWIIAGERKCETSLEEILIEGLNKAVKAETMKFMSSGREDVDVRMLGNGRPFVFECVNAKKSKFTEKELLDLAVRVSEVHKDVAVNSLKIIQKADLKKLKEGETSKRKRYTALCVTKLPYVMKDVKKLESMKDLELQQETPIRVLHRRSNETRKKIIHSMKTEAVNETMFKLEVVSSAGTYIKELVHGDFNRTVPNLRTILDCDIDIVALDVEEVYFEWPPGVHVQEVNGERNAPVNGSGKDSGVNAELVASLSSSRCMLGKRGRDDDFEDTVHNKRGREHENLYDSVLGKRARDKVGLSEDLASETPTAKRANVLDPKLDTSLKQMKGDDINQNKRENGHEVKVDISKANNGDVDKVDGAKISHLDEKVEPPPRLDSPLRQEPVYELIPEVVPALPSPVELLGTPTRCRGGAQVKQGLTPTMSVKTPVNEGKGSPNVSSQEDVDNDKELKKKRINKMLTAFE